MHGEGRGAEEKQNILLLGHSPPDKSSFISVSPGQTNYGGLTTLHLLTEDSGQGQDLVITDCCKSSEKSKAALCYNMPLKANMKSLGSPTPSLP